MDDDKYREVVINLDNSEMTILLYQGDMTEDEFIERAIDYVLSNISVEVK